MEVEGVVPGWPPVASRRLGMNGGTRPSGDDRVANGWNDDDDDV